MTYFDYIKEMYPERISIEGLEKAVEKGLITEEQKEQIINE